MSGRKIAFLGTGLMGAPMARRLLDAGFPLTVWNRDRSKADPLAEHGATVADVYKRQAYIEAIGIFGPRVPRGGQRRD